MLKVNRKEISIFSQHIIFLNYISATNLKYHHIYLEPSIRCFVWFIVVVYLIKSLFHVNMYKKRGEEQKPKKVQVKPEKTTNPSLHTTVIQSKDTFASWNSYYYINCCKNSLLWKDSHLFWFLLTDYNLNFTWACTKNRGIVWE